MTKNTQSASMQTGRPQVTRKAITTAGLGNCVEWLDFGTYAFLAATIGKLFFPSSDPQVSLLASLGAFAAAFLIRPLGGLFFGPLGDRIGGTAPLIAASLVTATGITVAPAFYLVFGAVVSLIAVLAIRESAGQPLAHENMPL